LGALAPAMHGKIMKRSSKRRRVRAVPASSSMLPADLTDDALLSRTEAALWLTLAGAPITAHRLAVLATLGSGPAYAVVFNRAKYRIGHLRAWLGELTAVTFTSTAARFEYQRHAKQQVEKTDKTCASASQDQNKERHPNAKLQCDDLSRFHSEMLSNVHKDRS
jgi:hypothetical protein